MAGPGIPAGLGGQGRGPQRPEDEADEPASTPPGHRSRHFLRELLIIVVVAAALTLMVKAFVVQVYRIPSASMENTLQIGDRSW